jgi:hypothetical protein
MSTTTTSVKMKVNLFERAAVYQVNSLLQLLFRTEHFRIQGGHFMTDYLEIIERGLKTWLTEQTLERVYCEIYSPHKGTAYERLEAVIDYVDNPTEEVVKAPVGELEELMGKLAKLPADATLRVLVSVKEGHTVVEGWGFPDRLKDFEGGVKEEHQIGKEEGHGYGPVKSRMTYYVSNWNSGETPPPA